jgi:putative two-component system response regulator
MNQNTPKPTILVVDDAPSNIDILKGMLGHDYVVQAAVSGTIALKIIEKKKPDLILLDIMMPEMNGHEVCKKLKENPAYK